MSHSEDGGVT